MLLACISRGRNPGRYRWVAILLAAALFFGDTNDAAAQTITIAEVSPLRFGKLEVPASGSHTFTVSTAGTTSGTGVLLPGSTVSAGNYTLSCSASCTGSWNISISVANVNSGNANVTIGSWTGNYIGVNIAIPSSGNPKCNTAKTLLLGATATYNSSAPVGALSPTYQVVVTTP